MKKNDIRKRERELYFESVRLKKIYLENKENASKEKTIEIMKEELEIYKRQQFFKNMINEMEKMKNENNTKQK